MISLFKKSKYYLFTIPRDVHDKKMTKVAGIWTDTNDPYLKRIRSVSFSENDTCLSYDKSPVKGEYETVEELNKALRDVINKTKEDVVITGVRCSKYAPIGPRIATRGDQLTWQEKSGEKADLYGVDEVWVFNENAHEVTNPKEMYVDGKTLYYRFDDEPLQAMNIKKKAFQNIEGFSLKWSRPVPVRYNSGGRNNQDGFFCC